MICVQGKSVCGGTASGTAFVFHRTAAQSGAECKTVCAAEELDKLELAVCTVKQQLVMCIAQAENGTEKDILDIHRMMLEDDDFLTYLRDTVRKGVSVQEAVSETEGYFSGLFMDTHDDYLIARIDDIRDVCGRLTAYLSAEETTAVPQNDYILVADDLLPGDLVRFAGGQLKGIITGSGTAFSHTSILIKEKGIPAIICREADKIKSGMAVLLDADSGTAYCDPDCKTAEEFEYKKANSVKKNEPSPFDRLSCGLYVNIGNVREIDGDLLNRCDGIGLFRTEFMYMGRPDLPDEEEQFSVYREILEKANGKAVTIRTFDIGSDKPIEALSFGKEDNPALGFRGLRVYSLYPDVFKTQLRALLRAAVYGDLRIMYPMVTSCKEIAGIRQMLTQTANELEQQGIPYKLPKQGAMIETPAAALLSDELAETVDFFSVGTNDLAQYTLAVDRQDGRLDRFCDPEFKAEISLIETAAKNAHEKGIEIGICGELASVPELTEKWIGLGIDYLSVSPGVINAF